MEEKPRISVAIPTHEMKYGNRFLFQSLIRLENQTFKDFEVVVSDNSEDYQIEGVCKLFKDSLNINYFRNPNKGMAQNSNSAIKASKGELIKLLYLDDFLASDNSLKYIEMNFRDTDNWLVTGCNHTYGDEEERTHPHMARYSDDIHTGNNTIGSPSVMTIRNEEPLLFDENLTWLLDCDLYKRYYDKHGPPMVVDDINVVIRLGDHQATNILPDKIKRDEFIYLQKKHEEKTN